MLSSTYQQQGYQLLSDEEIARGRENSRINKHSNPKLDCVYWKNEQMDVFEATAIEDEFLAIRDNTENNFKIDIWKLANFYKVTKLEDRLNLVEGSKFEFNDPDQEYILKKLNYNK